VLNIFIRGEVRPVNTIVGAHAVAGLHLVLISHILLSSASPAHIVKQKNLLKYQGGVASEELGVCLCLRV